MTLDLSQLKKRFQSDSVVALTIDADRILVSRVQRDHAPTPPISLGITPGVLLENPIQAGATLATALESAGIRERRCVVCVPPTWTLLTSVDLPEAIAQAELHGYFELRAEREFSTSDLRLAHSPYSLPDGKQRATLAALPIPRMEALDKMLKAAHCHPLSISLALDGCFSKAEPVLHFLVHTEQTDVVISSGGGIAAIRSLPNPSSSDPAAFTREMRITLGRLPESIRQRVQTARIVGPQDVIPLEVLRNMGFANLSEESGTPGGAATECAELVLREQPVPFEFIVPEVKRWPAMLERFNTKRGRQIAAAAAALILLPVLAFIIGSSRERHYNAEWNRIKNTVADLENVQQKTRKFRSWFEPGPEKLQALKTLISAFPDRGDVWTRSVQITAFIDKSDAGSRVVQSSTASSVTVSGFARSNSALMGLQDGLSKQPGVTALKMKQIRGNNPIQFTLTFKWEPKHD